MSELMNFLEKEFPNGCSIMTPQFERTEELEFTWKPQNPEEFNALVNKAPYDILKGFGFRKWDTMNNVIKENSGKPKSKKVEIPIINSDENLCIDIGSQDSPTTLLEKDEDILLFPHEWYNVIPENFMVTGLYGEQYPFKKGDSDDDKRFGCLPYGIRKLIITKKEEK